MSNCLFCKIINKEIPSKIIYEDDQLLAFDDINPQAPVHFLVIPKQHISTLNDLEKNHESLMGIVVNQGTKLAKEKGLEANGYRLVFNCNAHAGQTVFHIHLHVLGGRQMTWPPG